MEDKNERARKQAQAQLESIKEMVAALTCNYDRLEEPRELVENERVNLSEFRKGEAVALALTPEEAEELRELEEVAGDCQDADQARQRIEEDALSVEVRSGWSSYSGSLEAEEYRILLCTGGPAVQIIGDLDRGQPNTARLMFQDWFTQWEELVTTGDDNEALLEYARTFYFGD